MPEPALEVAPRPSFVDHLRVAWLFVLTVAGGIPFLVYLPLSPLLTPWLRARARRRLGGEAVPPASPPAVDAAACADKTVFLVVGEASGDELAARVVRRMKAAAPDVRVRGYAGAACREAGAELDRDITANAVFGFFGVVWSLGYWWKLCAETLARFREDPPDLLLTVDFPGLNVRLARWAKKRGIRTVHLVAPQLWAHTPWRIVRWRRAVDLVLATFPFAPSLFERAGLHTVYVGHPLFEAPLPPPRGSETLVTAEPAVVELWPGSRARELHRHARMLVEAAADVGAHWPNARFVVRLAKDEHRALFEAGEAAATRRPEHLTCITGAPTYDEALLGALAASGTATAQLAADLVPMSVFYRVGFVEWCFAKMLITAPWISLANLVLGRALLPERLCFASDSGAKVSAEFLAAAGNEPNRSEMRAGLEEVRARLETPDVAARTARVLLAELARRRENSSQVRVSSAVGVEGD